MKIFISWSGEKSKEIASVFKDWIPAVIQAAKPYFSPSDIDKGARWSNEIAQELEASRIGLICLTDDNLEAPWLMFEAGALSKSMDKARVCPLLFGVEPTDLAGPLVQFQAAPFSKEEVHKVIKTINAQLGELALQSTVLDSVFEKWWPDLEEKVLKSLSKERKKSGNELRSDRELLEEVLKMTRTIFVRDGESSRPTRDRFVATRFAPEFIEREIGLISEILSRSTETTILMAASDHLNFVMHRLHRHLPEETESHLLSRARSLMDGIQEKIKQLEEIPF